MRDEFKSRKESIIEKVTILLNSDSLTSVDMILYSSEVDWLESKYPVLVTRKSIYNKQLKLFNCTVYKK